MKNVLQLFKFIKKNWEKNSLKSYEVTKILYENWDTLK